MELKIKLVHWSAGLPVAMINKKTAEKLGVHPGDRITIQTLSKKPKEMGTILDIVKNSIKEEELAISIEIKKKLNLREGQKINVSLASAPESVKYVQEKIKGRELSDKQIHLIIKDVVENNLSEPEVAVFISGMYRNGMTKKETISLINAILDTGKKLKFNNKYVVDKHCIGGIAGNRTTPIVVAICAAAGLTFPKTSSRAITSAAGTADCIEVLSPVEFSMEKLTKIVKKVGACLAWGGSLGMVPADSKIIKVEKMLKLDPTAQLLASIMSKKIAAGSKYILIDIPYGKKAKVSYLKAKSLKKKFKELGDHFKLKLEIVLTKARGPIGNGVGPVLEMIDVLKILNPKKVGPRDLEEKSIFLSAKILELTKKAKKGEGTILACEILESGRAFEKFKEIIHAQGGEVKDLESSKISFNVHSKKSGKIKEIDNKKINDLAREAGCPLDKFAGVYLHYKMGEKVKKGEIILTIYAESHARLKAARRYYEKEKPIRI